MGKFSAGNGQYVVYASDSQQARQVISQELQRVDKIKEKVAELLSKDGIALQNFMENSSDENLNIHFNDATSLIYDDPENTTTKGEVRQRSFENGKFTYELAYRYPKIDGHDADFRLAHEMGHLVLNPSNTQRQIYNQQADSIQVSGLIRVPRGKEKDPNAFYGKQMQENAINLIAQLAVRGEHSADDIITGKVDVSEFNLYKQCDDLVKLLAVSMRNDYDKEMSFEELVNNKIDSFIEHSDGSKEPANTFFYGLLNDSSMIENEFDKYMGKGAWRDLDTFITNLHKPNISKEQFDMIFQEAQGMITEFAHARMHDKHKEAVARDGDNVPSLDNKMNMINEMVGVEQEQVQQPENGKIGNAIQFPEGYRINEFGEIIRPVQDQVQQVTELYGEEIPTFTPPNQSPTPSFKQKIAQFLQKNNILMNIPFVEKFVDKQLNVLPPAFQTRISTVNSAREAFVNWISNNGEYRNLPPIRRMSDPERMAQMQRRMNTKQQSTDDNERF